MAFHRDIGALLTSFPALDAEVITAAAGNDGSAVTGNILDRLASPTKGFPALSGTFVIPYKTVLTDAKTLSYAASIYSSASASLATGNVLVPIVRAREIKSDGTVTNLTIQSDGTISATVLVTASGSTTRRGVLELDVNLSSAGRYLRLTNTFDLSHTSTDTVAYGGVLVLGGAGESVNT